MTNEKKKGPAHWNPETAALSDGERWKIIQLAIQRNTDRKIGVVGADSKASASCLTAASCAQKLNLPAQAVRLDWNRNEDSYYKLAETDKIGVEFLDGFSFRWKPSTKKWIPYKTMVIRAGPSPFPTGGVENPSVDIDFVLGRDRRCECGSRKFFYDEARAEITCDDCGLVQTS